MPSSRQRRRSGRGEVMPPLSVLDRIDALLKEHLSIFPTKTELTEPEIEHWHRDLNPYTVEAIEYAFDSWRRNGRFFPVYADIIELCQAWEPPVKIKPECSEECMSRHWRGYGWPDVMRLWTLYNAKIVELKRRLNATEVEKLYEQIDQERGQVPAWRA